MWPTMYCLDCEEELEHLDTIVSRATGVAYMLYVCRNEECDHCGQVYNDQQGDLREGDPSGNYPNQLG